MQMKLDTSMNYGYKTTMEYAKQHYFDKLYEEKSNV